MWIQLLFPIILVAGVGLLLRSMVIGRRPAVQERSAAERVALWLAFGFAVAGSLYLLVVPTYSGLTSTQSVPGGVSVSVSGRRTLLQVEGLWTFVVLSFPVVLTAAGLAARASAERRAVIRASALLLTVFVFLASFSVGWAFLPAAAVLWIAALVTPRPNVPPLGE